MGELVDISIIKVNDPGDFLGKESPTVHKTNNTGRFYQAMQEMNEYCNNEQLFFNENFQPKLLNEIYAGLRLKDKMWHRVRIENILQTSRGRQCSVLLIDYGEDDQIPVSKIRKIPEEFQSVSVQVCRFSLYGIQAMTMALDTDLMAKKVPCVVWDEAATAYMKKLNKVSTKSRVEIKYVNQSGIKYVRLYLNTPAGKICVNDDLVKKEYATLSGHKSCTISPQYKVEKPVEDYEIDHLYKTIQSTQSHQKSPPQKLPQQKSPAKPAALSPKPVISSQEDFQFFKQLLDEHKQTRIQGSLSTDYSSNEDTDVISPLTKPSVSDSEMLKQRLLLKPSSPLEDLPSLSRLSDLTKLLKAATAKNESFCKDNRTVDTPTIQTANLPKVVKNQNNNNNVPLKSSPFLSNEDLSSGLSLFKPARLPKHAIRRDSDTESVDSSLSSVMSVPKSLTNKVVPVLSPVKSDSILRKSRLVKRLSDVSDSPSVRFSQVSSEEDYQPSNEDHDTEALKLKFLGQSAGKRLLEKLVPRNKKYKNASIDTLKSLPELIHGINTSEPYRDLETLPFAAQVKEYIEKCKFASMMTIQAYSWPAILKGRSVVSISPSKTGKTLTYLAPVLTRLFSPSEYTKLPNGCGPIVLILVSSWKKAQYVHDTCRDIVSGRKDSKILVLYAGGSEDSQTFNLLDGCKIMVATPNCLLRVLEKGYTNLTRLCHLILDDAEILTERFKEQINSFMLKYALALKETIELEVPRQIILVSSQWTPYVEAFTKTYLQAPLIMILSRTEAAVYGNVKQVVHMCATKQRSSVLARLLENIDKKGHKIMIFASEIDDVEDIRKLLFSRSLYAIIAHNQMTLEQLEDAATSWRDAKPDTNSIIMVCTDECIANLSITDATDIIHYDQPPSKTKFGVRLSCLFNYYRNLPENLQPPINPVSDILVTEKSLQAARTLSSFLQRSGSTIPPEFTHLVAGLQAGRDDDENIALCPYVKAFGKCSNQLRCLYRHQLLPQTDNTEDQINKNLPVCGEAKIKILMVIDASHYFARLLEIRHKDNTVQDLTADYIQLFTEMDHHFKTNPHKIHRMSKVGDMCSINDSNNQYHRVKILKIYYSKEESTSQKALVQFIDNGTQKSVQCSQLLSLPSHLKAYPPQAIEVYLCRVRPIDKDTEWTPKANSCVFDMINNIIMDGRIILSLGNIVWIDPLVHREHLETIKSTINKLNVRSELINNKLATDNSEHCRDLIELFKDKVCVDDSIIKWYSDPSQYESDEESEILPEGLEFHDVYLTAVDHPGLFYVQKIDMNQIIEEVQDKIKEKIDNDEIGSLIEPPSVGDYCLAPVHDDQEHRWYRAKVLEVEDVLTVKVYFVDYGDIETMEFTELKYLPRRYQHHPHQAIECRLADIKPIGGEWNDETGNLLWDLTRYINKDYKRMVAQVCSKTTATRCGRHQYEIKLYDTTSEYDIDISKEILWRLPSMVCCDTEQIKVLFPKDTASISSEALNKVSDISSICSLIYWNQDSEVLVSKLQSIVTSNINDNSKIGLMSISGGIKTMVQLLGYISNTTSHGVVLSTLIQAILHSEKFSSYCGMSRIQHNLIKCLEEVSSPVIQEQAAECIAKLAHQKESLREGWANQSYITTICDVLETTESEIIQCYMCQTLAALLEDNQRTCNIIQEENAVNIASQILTEPSHHNTQEAAIQFLSALSYWDSAQKKIKKDSVITAIMLFMNKALCNTCLHYGVKLYQYLSQTSRKNKTLLLEKHIFVVIRRLLSLDIDPKTKTICNDLQSSLAVRMPQQDLNNQPSTNHKLIPASECTANGREMPPVSWSQTSYKVRVTVNVHGCREEDFIITDNSIQFKAQLDNRDYGFDLELFDEVKTATSRVDIIGNRAQLSLNKLHKGMWSRLLKEKQKIAVISRDFEKVVASSDSENSDEHIPTLVKGKKSRLPKTGPEKKHPSPYINNGVSDSSTDSLVIDSEEERLQEDDFNFFEYLS